ncbi:MAG TPA: peptidoglycan-binding domain-containing protein, partial [Bryobacteraceae bacterium]|nr:peptidoglycan-binding domain-containing protein [Bryobacteraceae bacterium]
MTIRRGASGADVKKIQARLAELNLYRGPIDGSFGGGTEAAVKTFQRSSGIAQDGSVGSETWTKLFGDAPPPVNDMAGKDIALRCLALTASFETGSMPPDCFCGVTGDFDGQGISFGALQWNLGQGTLQPLLAEMFEQHPALCRDIFHENFQVVTALGESNREEQIAFARSIQNRANFRINEPWKGMLKQLGRTPEFQTIQAEHAAKIYGRALAMCKDFGLATDRGAALMFDICVQNGSISAVVRAQIHADFASLPNPHDQVSRMRIIANRRASAARPDFVNDVRTRKLVIAEGEGTVHGIHY